MNYYTNKHLTEVLCTFEFADHDNWDIAYFGQFFDKIKNQFSEKQEQTGFEIKFDSNTEEITPNNFRQLETRMLFKDPRTGFAITMGKKNISFHRVNNYTNWNDFVEQLLKPYLRKYEELSLNLTVQSCQVVYLNKFEIDESEHLSEYFSFVTEKPKGIGNEHSTSIVRTFIHENSILLVVKLNSSVTDKKRQVYLECGAISLPIAISSNAEDKIELANRVKAPIRDLFESVITDKLRKQL